MTHTDKHGNSKLLSECTLPLTGVNCITRIITDLAVLEVAEGAFVLKETAPGVTVDEIQQKTQGKLVVPDDVNVMVV
jgi:3-oxoacid CoA-transferase subunit B